MSLESSNRHEHNYRHVTVANSVRSTLRHIIDDPGKTYDFVLDDNSSEPENPLMDSGEGSRDYSYKTSSDDNELLSDVIKAEILKIREQLLKNSGHCEYSMDENEKENILNELINVARVDYLEHIGRYREVIGHPNRTERALRFDARLFMCGVDPSVNK